MRTQRKERERNEERKFTTLKLKFRPPPQGKIQLSKSRRKIYSPDNEITALQTNRNTDTQAEDLELKCKSACQIPGAISESRAA